ncbi:expressed unknown protein [Seminavis robusta]|uniref:Uncharacterized protein n=1 Tax=Seminavis robusta TaxID=568900 RepID=A0A9N8DNJ1_9STRA|nr:expressed unknown protein [Seminavis robusta]|eukprot:Sro178_g078050.1 n/a (251) ;mRNA; r:19954-20706
MTSQVGSSFEMAFLDRHRRFPKTDRDYKIMPMIFFQQQFQLKKANAATKIQHWWSKVMTRRRVAEAMEKEQSPMMPKAVRFVQHVSTEIANDTPIGVLKARQKRIKDQLDEFAIRFEQENGRPPQEDDFCAVEALRRSYHEVKTKLRRAKKMLELRRTPDRNPYSESALATVNAMIFSDEKKSDTDDDGESVCSSVLRFSCPSGSKHDARLFNHDDDDQLARVIDFISKDTTYKSPYRRDAHEMKEEGAY